MNEYLLSAQETTRENWQDNIRSHKNVKIKSKDGKRILISCNEETLNQIKNKFPCLKIELIFI